ncbi:MAG TPA: ABC-three component system protein [Candidatus Brocadiaceae bacterium]|nr:ABC-three component system protein [Candidatus Brocadiaceae bacterium]
MPSSDNQFSAAAQELGYLYQLRYALFQILRLTENTVCFIEKDDDIDFTDPDEGRILASLKHKAPGDTLTDLSPDFWKSVRIWLTYYIKNNNSTESVSFFLFTTGRVAVGSFLAALLPNGQKTDELASRASEVLRTSDSKTIRKTKDLLDQFPREKWSDFFRRITIFDSQERIQDIPKQIINERFRPIRPKFRIPVYERLEGWWNNECINLLTGQRSDPMRGWEVSEKLGSIADQFREDNLPIDFEYADPAEKVNPDSDERYFVKQLRAIGLHSDRIRRGILDYYRAFEQRGSWLRENVTLSGELEQYDDRLVDEWARLREIVFEELDGSSPEELLQEMGRKLLNQLTTIGNPNLRIRTGVTASFVTMGSYHMLANDEAPQVHWHPRFEERIEEILHGRRS